MEVNKSQVLRYLGYNNQAVDKKMEELIDNCMKEINIYSKSKYTYKIFNIQKVNDDIKLLGSNLVLRGKNIKCHLKDSSMCAVMAVTLGIMADNKIRCYEKFNLTKATILDACATAAVEKLCDEVQNKIRKEAERLGFGITYRYSPGYGDFSITIQEDIINALDTYKNMGLTCNENYILLPRKSVTAIIGFQDKHIVSEKPQCKQCSSYDKCIYRKRGGYCEC
ncbi:methionine synthase [Haloimpatiens sp. FM7330]|uniref:methionine synthase n=1 Tax=Haloimpatiens sp. FM7330 TaxID=3298610 RepID=UPI003633B696